MNDKILMNGFFFLQTYPDESHGLLSVRNHVYQTIGSYLLDCFNGRL